MFRSGLTTLSGGGDAVPDRLAPERYEPDWVPAPVRRYSARPDTLPVGSAGKVGVLELEFERVGERTELVGHFQKAPLHITRPHYYDPALSGMPYVMVMMSGGGVLQGDRYRLDASCGAGAAVHLTTQSATRLYRMEHDYATQLVSLDVGPGGYLEYLPDPTIAFGGSRYYQRTAVTLAPDATVVLGETMMAGRLARGERHAYTAYCTDVEVRESGGELVFADPLRLVPGDSAVDGPAVAAGFGVLCTLYVVTALRPAQQLADTMHTALHDTMYVARHGTMPAALADTMYVAPHGTMPAALADTMHVASHGTMHDPLAGTGLLAGAGVLPGGRGAWARLFGNRSPEVLAAFHTTWDAVRRALLDVPAPAPRKL